MPKHHIKLMCAKRDPNTSILSNPNVTISSDSNGDVFVSTALNADELLTAEDGKNLIIIGRVDSKKVKSSKVLLKFKDLVVSELTTTSGKEFIITARRPPNGYHEQEGRRSYELQRRVAKGSK